MNELSQNSEALVAKASFVIATRNNAATIAQCLSSLMPYYDQYIQDIVVVDGGSTDGTVEIVHQFPVKILSDPGRGQSLAYDIGWRHSEGELVIFFDADAYLGDGFFPTVYQYFDDERVGIVKCNAQFVVSDALSKTVSQWEEYLRKILFVPSGFLQRAHRLACLLGGDTPPPLGPCQAVRRLCLEAIDGYRGASLKIGTDVVLAKRVISHGWKAGSWLSSPVHHYPRSTIRGLVGECVRWGRERACLEQSQEFKAGNLMPQRLAYVLGSLASPFMGIILTVRFSNPWHVVLFPLTRYTSLVGYLQTLFTRHIEEKVP